MSKRPMETFHGISEVTERSFVVSIYVRHNIRIKSVSTRILALKELKESWNLIVGSACNQGFIKSDQIVQRNGSLEQEENPQLPKLFECMSDEKVTVINYLVESK